LTPASSVAAAAAAANEENEEDEEDEEDPRCCSWAAFRVSCILESILKDHTTWP